MNSVIPKNPCRFESAIAQTFGKKIKNNNYFHSRKQNSKAKIKPHKKKD
jgi:hypothetical protein